MAMARMATTTRTRRAMRRLNIVGVRGVVVFWLSLELVLVLRMTRRGMSAVVGSSRGELRRERRWCWWVWAVWAWWMDILETRVGGGCVFGLGGSGVGAFGVWLLGDAKFG